MADGPIGSYFAARGGVRTFGPPVSNAFPLLGSTVQIFRDHVLTIDFLHNEIDLSPGPSASATP